MRPPVIYKSDMYRRRDAGEFGNTLPRWNDLDKWYADNTRTEPHMGGRMNRFTFSSELWGVQHSTVPGWPGTRLNVHWTEVPRVIKDGGFGGDYTLTAMVRAGSVLWEGDIHRSWDGALECWGNLSPAPGSWRTHMKNPRVWRGSAAHVLLAQVLNENSRDDLEVLLDEYPDHTVELSALDHCFGTHPHRNAVVWEVRRY